MPRPAVRELHEIRRGRVVIGANEAAVHSVLPFIRDFAASHPRVTVEVRRVPSRRIAAELHDRALDFGVLTFKPATRGCSLTPSVATSWCCSRIQAIRSSARKRVSIAEVGRQVVIAHNDPSPARERVLRLYERRHEPINIQISLPSLDGIKRAVEMGVGVAVLPRRCALTEIERGDLVAVRIPELSGRRTVRFVHRKAADLSHAATAFLDLVRGGGQAP